MTFFAWEFFRDGGVFSRGSRVLVVSVECLRGLPYACLLGSGYGMKMHTPKESTAKIEISLDKGL